MYIIIIIPITVFMSWYEAVHVLYLCPDIPDSTGCDM